MKTADAHTSLHDGIIRHAMLEKITSPAVVVDITYQCNARCSYCRWGDGKTAERDHYSINDILIRAETLKNLGVKRVVLSGGEPRLHPEIGLILSHYAGLVDDVIVITNGYGLGPQAVRELLHAGATGITISLDSVDAQESFQTRRTPPKTHSEILDNIKEISMTVPGFEFGINATISHVTSNWATVVGLLEFGKTVGLDFIKFQPLFDDGYASNSAPKLLLTEADIASLMDISERLVKTDETFPLTNPPRFWKDIAVMCSGKPLLGSSCGLNERQSTSTGGKLGMCYWVGESSYGAASESISHSDILRVQNRFDTLKRRCNVDFHCFCTQRIDHVWA
ncbi:MAG: radical SAM protein [Nitrosopumilus sp. D6]|nr:MAG: radical SAM protein [Nitrosopumilus sp. D6]